MLQITKIHQFFVPSVDFSLSDLSNAQKSKIKSIKGESSFGAGFSWWTPNMFLPTLNTLKANRCYWIESKSAGFSPYSLGIEAAGFHAQNSQISKVYQFFTFRGSSGISLGDLSESVKSNIHSIFRITTSGSMLVAWRPSVVVAPPFTQLLPQNTYIVRSNSRGFSPHNLGFPDESANDTLGALAFVNESLIPDDGFLTESGIGI